MTIYHFGTLPSHKISINLTKRFLFGYPISYYSLSSRDYLYAFCGPIFPRRVSERYLKRPKQKEDCYATRSIQKQEEDREASVYNSLQPTDMRRSFDSLAGGVKAVIGKEPLSRLGRKNWFFTGSYERARWLAIIYSLFGMCTMNNINPYEYIDNIFTKGATYPAYYRRFGRLKSFYPA